MATFKVSDESGSYKIEAPDESSAFQAFQQMRGGAPAAEPAPAAPAPEPKGVMDTVKDVALRSVPLVGPALGEMNRTGYSLNDAMRSFSTGVPIAGGLVKKLDAATNATLAPVIEPFLKEGPDSLKQANWGERYARALELQHQMDAKAAEKSPVLDTGLKVAGGVAGMIPAVAAAPAAFGAGPGGVLANTAAGAASGAALGGADALSRGEDPMTGAVVSGAMGAAGPVLAKGAGKVVDAFRGKADPVPVRTVDVAGEQIPLTKSNASRDFADSLAEQKLLDAGQPTARGFDDMQRAAMQRATENIVTEASPVAIPVAERVSGHDAATAVIGDLQQNQAGRRAQSVADQISVAGQEAKLRNDLSKGAGPRGDTLDAAEYLANSIKENAAAHKASTAAKYKFAGETEGAFVPEDFKGFANNMKSSLGRGEDPVYIDSKGTDITWRVLKDVEQNVGGAQFENATRFKSQTKEMPDGTIAPKEITVKDIERSRQRITQAIPDAKQKMLNGDGRDYKALLRVLDSFDGRIESLVKNGRFSGNGADFLNRMRDARASHADYMKTYHPADGPVDDVAGKLMLKIVGRYKGGAELSPGELSAAIYDLKSGQGGKAFRIGERLEKVFGKNSPQMGIYKEGLADAVAGSKGGVTRTPEEVADSIESYLRGPTRLHAERFLDANERASFENLAAANRGIIKNPPKDYIERTLRSLSGENGTIPQPSDLANLMMSYRGKDRVNLMSALKKEMTPESWDLTKRAMIEDVLLRGKDADHQAIASSIKKFLEHKDMAGLMFDQRTLDNLKLLQNTHERMVGVRGSVNNSKTGARVEGGGLKKTIDKVSETLLGLVGLGVGGLPGMATGFVAGHVLKGVGNRAAERAAVDAFYGPQVSVRSRIDPSGLAIAGQGAIPALVGRR